MPRRVRPGVPRAWSLPGSADAAAIPLDDGEVPLPGPEHSRRSRPYERPPLSKDYLLGKTERETIYVRPPTWYADHGVDLRLGALVAAVDPAAREVMLADSDRIRAALQTATRVVVIGAGWIGLETAAAARSAGAEVTVLEAAELSRRGDWMRAGPLGQRLTPRPAGCRRPLARPPR